MGDRSVLKKMGRAFWAAVAPRHARPIITVQEELHHESRGRGQRSHSTLVVHTSKSAVKCTTPEGLTVFWPAPLAALGAQQPTRPMLCPTAHDHIGRRQPYRRPLLSEALRTSVRPSASRDGPTLHGVVLGSRRQIRPCGMPGRYSSSSRM